ncbi:MAG: CDP-alcohol phosphatidyltransferase family protein [Acholeplasmatales bacterium]|nr:CDP-alcohol phosphatidyltransferase family protein [Acholeplasmatales bacterium]
MIGYYNYTVILTYLSLATGSTGIFFALKGRPDIAVVLLLTAGLFDLFDGKVARTKKDRTHDEKNFGIQIDSLNDVICFGVLPACIGYAVGMTSYWFIPLFAIFILAGLIRLAYFNVRELNEFYDYNEEGAARDNDHCYYGMPITMTSLIVPAMYLLEPALKENYYIFYACLMGLLAICFIAKIRIPKPNKFATILLALLGTALCIGLIVTYILTRK